MNLGNRTVQSVMAWRRYMLLFLVCAGVMPLRAASGNAENNAFNSAARKFNNELWSLAAQDFSVFVTNFPTSFRVPEAVLFQAQALVKDRRYTAAVDVLKANQHRALELGDLYLYWIAHAHMGNSNFPAAAGAFAELIQQFPESTNCLEAVIGQATALARMEAWPDVTGLLNSTNQPFRIEAHWNTNAWMARGWILLGEAELKLGRPEHAAEAVGRLNQLNLTPEAAWRRLHLQTRIDLTSGRMDEARTAATNLLPLAQQAGSPALRAETFELLGGIFERMKRVEDAVACYEQNLTNGVPVEHQRTALFKITELSRPADAVRRLEQFRRDFPQSQASDGVLLALGELQLKQAATGAEVQTNLLLQAQTHFDLLLTNFPGSSLAGKAWLGKGWCLWYSTNYPAAGAAFRNAMERLPLPEDQAVARFKLADTFFSAGQLQPALQAYQDVVNTYAAVPEVKHGLLEQALYQAVRAAVALTNLPAATNALHQLLEWYPDGLMGDRCLFLVAEGFAQNNEPVRARELLIEFEERFADAGSPLLPQVGMAVSRTYEREGNWAAAITNYDAWIASYTNHPQVPEVQFARAWDTAMAGSETNALELFDQFVRKYPGHDLAPRARWWIGDYFFKQGNYGKAEENYPYTTNYAGSDLFFLAHLRAGAAAMARLSYKDAISYFTNVIANPRSPNDLKVKAAIAAGDACMARNEAGASNRIADLEEAAGYFNLVLKSFPTNAQAPLAWGRLGDCFKEMGLQNPRAYDRAVEAYNKVITAETATTGMRRQAKIGIGIIAEARAEGKGGAEQHALREEALAHYADAFEFEEIRRDEANDAFWYQKAGLETARMAELLGKWPQAVNIYRSLQATPNLPPAVHATLERRRLRALEQVRGSSGTAAQ